MNSEYLKILQEEDILSKIEHKAAWGYHCILTAVNIDEAINGVEDLRDSIKLLISVILYINVVEDDINTNEHYRQLEKLESYIEDRVLRIVPIMLLLINKSSSYRFPDAIGDFSESVGHLTDRLTLPDILKDDSEFVQDDVDSLTNQVEALNHDVVALITIKGAYISK